MSTTKNTRVARTVSIPAAQDRWLTELLGPKGNLSAFVQALIDAAQRGEFNAGAILTGQDHETPATTRAYAYLRAKEAGMLFEEDVLAVATEWLKTRHGLRVVRGRIHNTSGSTYVADFSFEVNPQDAHNHGEVRASVQCKSSPRPERLQLALAEAMIGTQKTGRPVITVVPYLTAGSEEVLSKFKMLGFPICTLGGLSATLCGAVTSPTADAEKLAKAKKTP